MRWVRVGSAIASCSLSRTSRLQLCDSLHEHAVPEMNLVRLFGKPRSCETADEVDHRGCDLVRALLLDPATAARQHDRAVELGNQGRLVEDRRFHVGMGEHRVAFADEEERRDGDPRAGKRGESSQLRSMLRYQLRLPRNPVRPNSAAKKSRSVSLSQAGNGGRFDAWVNTPPCRGTMCSGLALSARRDASPECQ